MKVNISSILSVILFFTAYQDVNGLTNTARRLPTCSSNSCTQSCTGHDACNNYIWTGNYDINLQFLITQKWLIKK